MSDDSSDEADLFCPALPPHLLKNQNSNTQNKPRVVGPVLPKNVNLHNDEINEVPEGEYDEDSGESENEDGDVVGPIPSAVEDDQRFNCPEMEDRLHSLIDKVSKKSGIITERESWMLELPSDKPNIAALGLGSRQFRKKAPGEIGDRSVWTDTPEMKKRKKREKNESSEPERIEDLASKRRDEELSDLVKKYDESKRSVPLVDSHMKKKAKTEKGKPKERKPFSREDDLHVNKFDDAQKETIMKKARQLNDRFSSGNRKFL